METPNVEHQGRVYPLCSVSVAVQTPLTINVLAHIHARFHCLPTHIIQTPFPTPLPSLVALLPRSPNDDQSHPGREAEITVICVMLSLPLVIHRNDFDPRARGKFESLLPGQASFMNARIVLENTLFVEELLGLSDSPHPQKSDLLRQFLAATQQAQEADERVEILERQHNQLKSRRRRELAAHELFNFYLEDLYGVQGKLWEAPELLEQSCISNLIVKERLRSLSEKDLALRLKSKLISEGVNSTKRDRTTFSEAGILPRCPLRQEWMSMQDLRSALQPGGVSPTWIVEQTHRDPTPSSENVPLFLDTKWGDDYRPWEQFQPALLRHRYERWLAQQEQQDHVGAARQSSTSNWLDKSKALSGTLLDVDLHSDRWQPLHISAPAISTRENTERLEQSNWNEDALMLSPDQDLVREHFDEMEDLNRYCHFDEHNEDGEESVPSMITLPHSRTWSIMNPDVVLMQDAVVRSDLENMFNPDFMIDQLGYFSDPEPSMDSLEDWTKNRMVLREGWARISPAQQRRLLPPLAKFLAAVWDQFQILQLPHSAFEDFSTTFAMDLDVEERKSTLETAMGSLLNLENEFLQGVHDGLGMIPYGTPEELDFEAGNIEDIEQMETSKVRARGSPDALHPDTQYTAPLQKQDRQETISMRQFDFSLDDLLIATGLHQDIRILSVTRWKTSNCKGPATHSEMDDLGSFPTSVNKYQSVARSSAYPLIHLFSLPDVFCPSELGGQGASEDEQGLAHTFVSLLAEQSMEAADFLTDDVQVKERKLYHRWMAEWHGRFVQGPRWRKTTPSKQQPQRHEHDHRFDFSYPEKNSGVGIETESMERAAFEATARFLENLAWPRKKGQGRVPSSADRESENKGKKEEAYANWAGIEKVAGQLGLGALWLSSAVPGAATSASAETKKAEEGSWFPFARGQCGLNREQREQSHRGLHHHCGHARLSLEQQRLVRQHMWGEEMD